MDTLQNPSDEYCTDAATRDVSTGQKQVALKPAIHEATMMIPVLH